MGRPVLSELIKLPLSNKVSNKFLNAGHLISGIIDLVNIQFIQLR